MHRIIYNMNCKGFGHPLLTCPTFYFISSIVIPLNFVTELFIVIQWNFSNVTSKRKTIFNEPIQLLRKSKLLEKCCWKTMNKKTQRKICTRSCPNRSYEIWKLIEERNWKCICIKVKTFLRASHPKEIV